MSTPNSLGQNDHEGIRAAKANNLADEVAKEGAHWNLDIQLDRLQVACGQEACNPSDALPSPAVRTRKGGEFQVPDGRVSREEVGGGLKGVPGVLHAELEPRGAAVAQGLQVDVHRSTATCSLICVKLAPWRLRMPRRDHSHVEAVPW